MCYCGRTRTWPALLVASCSAVQWRNGQRLQPVSVALMWRHTSICTLASSARTQSQLRLCPPTTSSEPRVCVMVGVRAHGVCCLSLPARLSTGVMMIALMWRRRAVREYYSHMEPYHHSQLARTTLAHASAHSSLAPCPTGHRNQHFYPESSRRLSHT